MAYVSNHMSTGTFGESSFGASGELSVASSELRQNVHPGGLWRCGSVEGLLTLAVVWTMLLRQEAGSSGELPVTCLYPRRALRWPRPMDIVLVSLPGGAWRSDEFGFHSTVPGLCASCDWLSLVASGPAARGVGTRVRASAVATWNSRSSIAPGRRSRSRSLSCWVRVPAGAGWLLECDDARPGDQMEQRSEHRQHEDAEQP